MLILVLLWIDKSTAAADPDDPDDPGGSLFIYIYIFIYYLLFITYYLLLITYFLLFSRPPVYIRGRESKVGSRFQILI